MDLEVLWSKLSEISVEYALKIISCLVVLIVGKLLIRLLMKYFLNGKVGKRMDLGFRNYTRTFVKVALEIVLVVIMVAILGVPVASIVTVIAAAGAAIALAIQGSLANVASGFILILTRPFKLDNWIAVGEKTGKVTDQGLFYTTIRTIENLDVVIPNSELTSSTIINYSNQDIRRSNFTISAAYGTDASIVRQVVLDYLTSHQLVLNDPAPFCAMSAMSESSIDFTVRFWAKSVDYWNAWYSIQEGIYNALNLNGITIPFNQLDVHITR